jgi:hypothetical protein
LVSEEDTAPDPAVEEASKPFEEAVHAEAEKEEKAEPEVPVEPEPEPEVAAPAAEEATTASTEEAAPTAEVEAPAPETLPPATDETTSAAEDVAPTAEVEAAPASSTQPDAIVPVLESELASEPVVLEARESSHAAEPTPAAAPEESAPEPEVVEDSAAPEPAAAPEEPEATVIGPVEVVDDIKPLDGSTLGPDVATFADEAPSATTEPEAESEVVTPAPAIEEPVEPLTLTEPEAELTHAEPLVDDESQPEAEAEPETQPAPEVEHASLLVDDVSAIPAATSLSLADEGPEIAAIAALDVDMPAIVDVAPEILPDVAKDAGEAEVAGAEDDVAVEDAAVPAAEAEAAPAEEEAEEAEPTPEEPVEQSAPLIEVATPAPETESQVPPALPTLKTNALLAPALEASISNATTLLDTPTTWASDAPTPVEEDEVVLAPTDLLAAETIAAVDAKKAGLGDDLFGRDEPAEEAAAPAPADKVVGPAEDALASTVSAFDAAEVPVAPETEAEAVAEPEPVVIETADDDVHRAVAALDEVTTPRLDLDATTPDVTADLSLDSTAPAAPVIEVSDETGAATPLEEDVAPAKEEIEETKEEEHPNRPWTPSYSVRSQGPGTPAQEEEDAEIAPEPELKVCSSRTYSHLSDH